MANRRKTKRRKLLLYPWFQLSFILCNTLFFVLFGGFVFYRINQSFLYMIKLGEKAQLGEDHPFYQYLQYQQDLLYTDILYSGGIFVVISMFFSAIISHRVAGPFYRTKVFLQDYFADQVSGELKFRRFDYFKDIALLINKALQIAKKRRLKD